MGRTENDSWDITESVGTTALGVALARANETTHENPLFTDPFAQLFIDAAIARGWGAPPPHLAERIRAIGSYAASRTKWFDEFFIAAGANGVEQAVILAAGLDARAWRLPWVHDNTVYEVDQPKVLEFKSETLRSHDLKPTTGYVPVPIDLRQDWPAALRSSGFDTTQQAAWSAEGLLPYLSASDQDALFERITELSAPGSRIAVESFGADFFESDYLARRSEQMRRLREEAEIADDAPDPQDLWFIEERTDLGDWLSARGWRVKTIPAAELMERYGRLPTGDAAADIPRTVFIEARLRG